MTTSLIWDMDGTLIDSYDSIVACIEKTLQHFLIRYDKTYIRDIIQKESTAYFFKNVVEKNNNIEFEKMWKQYHEIKIDLTKIVLMPNVKEMFERLKKKGINNFIFTHRGISTYEILNRLKIEDYFIEVLSVEEGFKRKPDPEAINYLVNKYHLKKKDTYYVGDRLIDLECAKNADIGSIYYQSYKGININSCSYDYRIDDLLEIVDIF